MKVIQVKVVLVINLIQYWKYNYLSMLHLCREAVWHHKAIKILFILYFLSWTTSLDWHTFTDTMVFVYRIWHCKYPCLCGIKLFPATVWWPPEYFHLHVQYMKIYSISNADPTCHLETIRFYVTFLPELIYSHILMTINLHIYVMLLPWVLTWFNLTTFLYMLTHYYNNTNFMI